jgi:hypothetical protein
MHCSFEVSFCKINVLGPLVLVCVGTEVSPSRGGPYCTFSQPEGGLSRESETFLANRFATVHSVARYGSSGPLKID